MDPIESRPLTVKANFAVIAFRRATSIIEASSRMPRRVMVPCSRWLHSDIQVMDGGYGGITDATDLLHALHRRDNLVSFFPPNNYIHTVVRNIIKTQAQTAVILRQTGLVPNPDYS
jgi:hypothetical protein